MMHPRSPKWLEDIASALMNIRADTAGKTLGDYGGDRRIRQLCERNFELIGEALVRLERTDPVTVYRITNYRKIIGFRNRIAHDYDDIDDQEVWDIIQHSLPVLRAEVDDLLREVGAE
jgi:uncharacterized protein with HEPN domain